MPGIPVKNQLLFTILVAMTITLSMRIVEPFSGVLLMVIPVAAGMQNRKELQACGPIGCFCANISGTWNSFLVLLGFMPPAEP